MFTILTHSFAKTDYIIIRITTKLEIIDLGSNDEQGGFWVQCFQSFDHMCSINVGNKMYTGAGSVWLQSFSYHQRTLCQRDTVHLYTSKLRLDFVFHKKISIIFFLFYSTKKIELTFDSYMEKKLLKQREF